MNGLFQNITHALGWSIVHSLWQGVLIYGVLCTIYIVLPKIPARSKYILAVSGQSLVFLAFAGTLIHYLDFSVGAGVHFTEFNEALFIVSEYQSVGFLNRLEPLFPWFSSIYVIGLFIQLIVFTNNFSKLHYLKTRGLHDAPILWQEAFDSLYRKMNIQSGVSLYLSEKVDVPLTLGHLKPIILFPIAYASNLDIKQVESILIHELAHIKRHDYLINLFKVCVETAMFFNPFVWLLSKHMETEREHACDDIVVTWVPSPIAYAQALMSVELLRNEASPNYAMAATGNHKYHLLHRIQRITKMEKNYINVKQHLFALLLSSIALGTIAWIAPQEKQERWSNLEESNTIDTKWVAPAMDQPLNERVVDTTKVTEDRKKQGGDSSRTMESKSPGMPLQEVAKESENNGFSRNQQSSPEMKERVAAIEANAKRIEQYYNSAEWKQHIAKVEENAKRVEDYYNSPAGKQHIAKIEENARRVEDYYNSPAWKQHVAKIEENAKKIEAQYNSPEWKQKIQKIEENAKQLTEYYNSPEWKERNEKHLKVEEPTAPNGPSK